MSGIRAALRTRVETTYSIKKVVHGVNRFLYESTGPESFVTAFYGVLDSLTNRFTYVNAGHNPPLLRHADGRIVYLQAGGPLLGVMKQAVYEKAVAHLEPGAILVMYTDGIVEAGGDVGEEYGEERVEQIVTALKNEPAAVIAREIEKEAALWNQHRGEHDDRTVIVLKRH